jgi:hypothetical protein
MADVIGRVSPRMANIGGAGNVRKSYARLQ